MINKIVGAVMHLSPRIIQPTIMSKWNDLSRNNSYVQKIIISDWIKSGKPSPPPHIVKQLTISKYQKESNYNILVETGTFLGDMIKAQENYFKKIYSIELSTPLFQKAAKRFEKNKKINILNGDSGEVLKQLSNDLDAPSIFWLDGHYSGGFTAKGDKVCPVFEELDAIFKSSNFKHIILIDDARLFVGDESYPTLNELKNYTDSLLNNYSLNIEDDIIRLTPKSI